MYHYNDRELFPQYEAENLIQQSEKFRKNRQSEEAIRASEAAVTLLKQNNPGSEYYALDELGMAFMDAGKMEGAIPCFREATEVISNRFYPNHPSMISALDHWCKACIMAGDLELAEQICQRSLSIKQASHHPQDIHVLETMRVLADIQRQQGKYQEAEALLKKAVAIVQQSTMGPVEEFLYELGLVYLDQDRKEDAESVLFEALTIFAGRLGKHRRFAMCVEAYAEAVKRFGLREDSWRLLAKANLMMLNSTRNTSIENMPGALYFEDGLYPTTILH